MNEAQKQLVDFYQSIKDCAPAGYEAFSDLSGPDLICIDDDYLKSTSKIAIIGQQTNGWDYTFPEFITDWEVIDAIEAYKKFDYAIDYPASPFWDFFHKIRTLQNGLNSNRRTVLWTNLVKFVTCDQESILSKPFCNAALVIQDEMLKTELRLAAPKTCIFVTGPDYDYIIERYYPGVLFQSISAPVREFAKLVHPDLPEKSYRCYHPKYLRLSGLWEPVIATLTNELG